MSARVRPLSFLDGCMRATTVVLLVSRAASTARDLVLIHKVDLEKRPEIRLTQAEWGTIVQMVLASASTAH